MALSGPVHLARPRLVRRLVDAFDAGALLLVAPAGYGKTVALTDALQQLGGAIAWVRCSAADADPGQLLRHTVAALANAAPGVADPFADKLAAAPARIDTTARASELAATLERLALDPLTIAFDDAEELGRDAAAILAPLLEARSPNLRVALCSRSRPPIPRASRLRASGRLTEIGPLELAFTPDECAAYLTERTGADPDSHTVDELYERTEGWPLGVAAAGARPPRTPLHSRDALLGYFEEEVLDRLDPELRAAALVSALPREIDATALGALGIDSAFARMASNDGLFLRPTEPNSGSSTYHPLFREFLLDRLEQERPGPELADLRARLAAARDAEGRGEEAIEHWLDGEAWGQAAAAIARTGPGLIHTAPASVERWLDRLPPTARRAPGIAFLEGRLTFGSGRAGDALPLLRAAVEDASATGDLQSEWIARYALADALYMTQRYAEVTELADGFDDEPATGAFAAPLVAIAAAASLSRGSCDYDAALALFRRAAHHPLGTIYADHEPAFAAFYADLPAGRLDEALAGIRKGIALCERSDPGRRLPYLWGFQAMIHEERGEDAEALAAIASAQVEAAEIRGYIERFGRLMAAGLHARAGRLAEAEAELHAAGDPVERGWFSGDAEVTRATIAVRRGDSKRAAALAEQAIANGAMSTWAERARATAHLAPVLAAAGLPARARELIDETMERRPAGASVARLEAIRAWLHHNAGDSDAALAQLATALQDAGAAAVHLLRREWPNLEPLVSGGVASGVLDRHSALAALESAFPGGDVLLPFTADPDPAVRRAAVRAVASSGNPAAAARAQELRDDPDPSVAAAARAAAELVARTPPPLVIGMFGGFTLRRGAWLAPDAAWGRRVAPRLVRLLLTSGEAVAEDAIFDHLWHDRDTATARRGLQVAVSAARRVLDLPGAPDSAIEARDGTYRVRLRDGDVLDTREFERAARHALLQPSGAALESAAAAWGGDPLPEDRYEPWAIAFRERLIDLRAQLLGALADHRAASGDAGGAVDAARDLVAIDPLAEGAHRQLMIVYARAGRRGLALRQFLECRRLLVDELGVEPDAETHRLHDAILAGEPL